MRGHAMPKDPTRRSTNRTACVRQDLGAVTLMRQLGSRDYKANRKPLPTPRSPMLCSNGAPGPRVDFQVDFSRSTHFLTFHERDLCIRN
jgi:hypothetical protein